MEQTLDVRAKPKLADIVKVGDLHPVPLVHGTNGKRLESPTEVLHSVEAVHRPHLCACLFRLSRLDLK